MYDDDLDDDELLDVRPSDELDPAWTLSPAHPSRRHAFPASALVGHVERCGHNDGMGAALAACIGLFAIVSYMVWQVCRWLL